jgi:tRNA dimethylallyltransferase
VVPGDAARPYQAVAIVGPTASGKSDLAIGIAQEFSGEIVNYDSVQIFRHLDIGTAKPTMADRGLVPHHLIDILEPVEPFSAGAYQRRARQVLDQLRERSKLPVLVGGTGFYLQALVEGLFDGPERSALLRDRLEASAEKRGREYLHRLLRRMDPGAAERIGPRDKPKVIRAIEVRLATGRTLSRHLETEPRRPLSGYDFCVVGLDPPRPLLYERIEARVRAMFDRGLVEEVRHLLDIGIPRDAKIFQAIGYRQVLDYLAGNISVEEAIISMQRETRRYAKRQTTWFKRQHTATWFDGFGDNDEIRKRIHRVIESHASERSDVRGRPQPSA